jgi:hypothetical protein
MKALRRLFLNKKLMWCMKSSWKMLSLRCRIPVSTTQSESPPRMRDDLDDLDDVPNEGRSDMDE